MAEKGRLQPVQSKKYLYPFCYNTVMKDRLVEEAPE